MTERPMSAIEAMELSEREDRVVHLEWSLAQSRELFADSDGCALVDGDGEWVQEYWGEGWRVHLHSDERHEPPQP